MLISLVVYNNDTIIGYNFECRGETEVSIETNNGPIVFDGIENLQFLKDGKGLIQFEGYVGNINDSTYLQRSVYLVNGEKESNSKFFFEVKSINKSPLDKVTDEIFDQLWLEISSDSKSININMKRLKKNIYVLISPYGAQLSCVTTESLI